MKMKEHIEDITEQSKIISIIELTGLRLSSNRFQLELTLNKL